MNHSFKPSVMDSLKCGICKWPEIQHTDNATCDVCPFVGKVEPSPDGKMLICKGCWDKEYSIPHNAVLTEVKRVDSSITLRTDLFNAATVAINEIKMAIDSDERIENKNYKLAEMLLMRFSHFKQVVFQANEAIIEASNQQKAIQIYLNNLANTLRAEERDKLKISDINYKPATVKPVKTEKVNKPKVKKLDKLELRKIAAEFNVPEFMLQMVATQRNLELRDAAQLVKNSLEAGLKATKEDKEGAKDAV